MAARRLHWPGMSITDPPEENPIQSEQPLGDVAYPARRDALLEHARRAGAAPSVCRSIAALPDRTYDSAVEVSEALARAGRGRAAPSSGIHD